MYLYTFYNLLFRDEKKLIFFSEKIYKLKNLVKKYIYNREIKIKKVERKSWFKFRRRNN